LTADPGLVIIILETEFVPMLTFYRTERLFENLTRNHTGVFCLTIFLGFFALISYAQAQTGFHLGLKSQQVPWSQLSFRAKNFWVEVSTDIQMKTLPASDLDAVLIASPKGTPIKPQASQVNEMTINTIIEPRFRSPVSLYSRIWFDPTNASILSRVMLRRGEDDFKKIYRFTDQGVFRHQLEPKDKQEAALDPEKWTAIKDSFYPYDLTRLECSGVTEPSILTYIINAAAISNIKDPLSLCAFGKRQLHRVTVQREGTYPVSANYIEKRQQDEIRKAERVSAIKIAVKAEPLVSDLNTVENFSFMGLRNDIFIYIDPASQLPVQVSGNIPAVGKTYLKLRQCQAKR
jgi:hypothetical protein